MDFEWLPEVLTQLNQYPDERFWGILIFGALVLVVCTWLVVKSK